MKAKSLLFAGAVLVWWTSSAEAATVTYTVTWGTAPAAVESYDVEKQVGTGAFQPLMTLPATALSFQNTGNVPGVATCFKVSPKNSLPSTGASAQVCHSSMGQVGNMPTLLITPTLVP